MVLRKDQPKLDYIFKDSSSNKTSGLEVIIFKDNNLLLLHKLSRSFPLSFILFIQEYWFYFSKE